MGIISKMRPTREIVCDLLGMDPVRGATFVCGDFTLRSVQKQGFPCFMVFLSFLYVICIGLIACLKARERVYGCSWRFHSELCADTGIFMCYCRDPWS